MRREGSGSPGSRAIPPPHPRCGAAHLVSGGAPSGVFELLGRLRFDCSALPGRRPPAPPP